MAGYIFRSRRLFTIQDLTSLEGVYVEDLDPPSAVVGIGSGNICLVGEFDDGPVNALTEIDGGDITRQFGSLGFTYAGVTANNPCARKRNGELWNGNGFIYSRFIRGQRFMVVRVDSSVGQVAFSPRAILGGGRGPFLLTVGDQLAVTASTGGPASSAAIAAAAATAVGSTAITATGFLGGEQFSIGVDSNSSPVIVTFGAGDQSAAAVVTRINNAAGAVLATQASGVLTLTGSQKGSGGSLTLANISPGVLAALKLTAGTTVGTGNVANVLSATPAEIAAIINGTSALASINVKAQVAQDGSLVLYDSVAGTGTLLIASGNLQTVLKLPANTSAVVAGQQGGGVIPAGTRVRTSGGAEWVTQQSFTVPAGSAAAPATGPFLLNVRPSFDDGTAVTANASTVTVLADQPTFANFSVNNPNALSAALTEGQLDAKYMLALDQTLDASSIGVDINLLYLARRSLAVDTYAASNNVEEASNNGCAGRKLIRSGALGITQAQAKADALAITGTDRVWFTWPGWQVTIPEILVRGAAGGLGFTDTGVITVRAAGTLAKLCALLNPEENPGQQTGLIEDFFAIEQLPFPLKSSDYRSLKAAGIVAPRRDTTAGSIFQSGVTTDITIQARQTIARRKMADFIEDTLARLCVKYSKKLNTEERQDVLLAEANGFLNGLTDANRIDSYVLSTDTNTDANEALGIFTVVTRVRTLSSMNAIEIRTSIGEGVVTSTQSDVSQAA